MRNVRKNMNAFLDGRGFAGQVEEFNPPKLTLKTEDFQGGGMFGPVALTMGHEILTADMTLLSFDAGVQASFSVAEGRQVQFTVREALESHDGTVTAVIHNMRGKVTEIDNGSSKPGEKSTTKVSLSLTYYKQTVGAIVTQEIDVVNMVASQNGVDVLAPIRAALGL